MAGAAAVRTPQEAPRRTPQMAAPPLLEVDDLTIAFAAGRAALTVVRGVSFAIGRGETVALVGESGSGKTVTGLALIGLIGKGRSPGRVSGRLVYRRPDGSGCDLAALSREAMRGLQGAEIAMIFQEPMTSLNPVVRVGDQIVEMILAHGRASPAAARREAEELLREVGIPEAGRRMRSYPHELSGGMRQRAMIAMAVACGPALLIADEPTTALDVTIQAQILDLLDRIRARAGSSILFISHDLAVVHAIADRILVMYAGMIVEEGPAQAVIGAPRHPYTAGLLACVPRLEAVGGPRRRLRPIPGAVPDPAEPPAGCPFHPRCAHARPGLCTTALPPVEDAGDGRRVRCLRWRELPAAAP